LHVRSECAVYYACQCLLGLFFSSTTSSRMTTSGCYVASWRSWYSCRWVRLTFWTFICSVCR